MSGSVLNCGYVPLVDSAPLILAKELGFARDAGIELNLLKQPSWAALRDLMALGHLEVAHMLSPLPLAMTMGWSGAQTNVHAPFVLSVNGTIVGAGRDLVDRMVLAGWQADASSPADTIRAVFAASQRPIRVGVPFPYSMHRLLFEYLVRGTPDLPETPWQIITMPPPLMAQAVAAGEVDVFCVGEPWGSVAVQTAGAELLFPGSAIWAHAPEKVLGVRTSWALEHPDIEAGLLRALYRAAAWLGKAQNIPLAIEILAKSQHLDLSEQLIEPALTGAVVPAIGRAPWDCPDFVKFHQGATTFPWRSLGAWIGTQCAQLRGEEGNSSVNLAGAQCFRPDLYRAHLEESEADLPGASAKIEGVLTNPTAVASKRGELILGPDAFFDGETFDFEL